MFSRRAGNRRPGTSLSTGSVEQRRLWLKARLAIDLDWSNGGNDDTFIRKLKEDGRRVLNALKTEIEGATARSNWTPFRGGLRSVRANALTGSMHPDTDRGRRLHSGNADVGCSAAILR